MLNLLRRPLVSRSSPIFSLSVLSPPHPIAAPILRIFPAQLRFQGTSPPAAPWRVNTDTEPRLQLTFTCTADSCGHRSTHTFTKRSYQSGIVLLQCPACKNRHLIADHIGWFKESTQDGTYKTVEDLLQAKGELVRRGNVYDDGTIEILPEPEPEPEPEQEEKP